MKKAILKREIIITPAFDKRNGDPTKDYGIGSCKILFVVIGKKGAISISFYTNWYLSSTIKEYKEGIYKNNLETGGKDKFKTSINLITSSEPIHVASWDYHSKKKQFEKQQKFNDCDYIKNGCYCDCSYMRGESYLTILLEQGSKGIFVKLEKDYVKQFEVKK